MKDQWAAGALQSEDPKVTQQANLSAIAEVRVGKELLELEFEEFIEVLNNEE